MGGKGTSLALGMMGFYTVVALLLFYIAWKYTDIHDHMLAAILGVLLLAVVLATLLFFFLMPENRRPLVFFLVFIGLILLPGIAFMVWQAVTGLRIGLGGPNEPPPLYLFPYLLLVAWVFIRMATWSMTFEPETGVAVVSEAALRQRMLALNEAQFPFTVKPGKRDDELIMEWKYADATWLGLMSVHKLSSLSRFIIRLDEADHTVRVRESSYQFGASGGMGGAGLSFNMQWGAISFYEVQRETVYGIQIENGRPVAKLSYSYRFDIKEMREPLLKLTLANGWTFKSVTVAAKWLTG